jgi:osmotically-inducible protein OsmY
MRKGSFMEDTQLLDDVKGELEWDPAVNAAHIGVSVNASAVTLTGYVTTFAEKSAAVQAAERVYGVRAIADEIEVRPPAAEALDDPHISEAIMSEFLWHSSIPESVKAEVKNGYVTLLGEVEWGYQRREAAELVRGIRGVKGLTNLIAIQPTVEPKDVQERVTQALKRNADLDERSIVVTTSDGVVHLYGRVHSWYEKKAAEQAAFAAPGVVEVDNEITVTA